MNKDDKNKRKQAIALQYNAEKQQAPRVLAKGKGLIAENILAKAAAHDIPVQEDHNLIELLGNLDINETIPEELYQAVAEVFAFLYRIDKEAGKS